MRKEQILAVISRLALLVSLFAVPMSSVAGTAQSALYRANGNFRFRHASRLFSKPAVTRHRD